MFVVGWISLDLTTLLSQILFTLLLAVIFTLIVFPFVFLMSFFYESSVEKHPKTPKIVFQLLFTFIACALVILLLSAYVGFDLPSVITPATSIP